MQFTKTDEMYMDRALELALHGLGRVSPNPMVGCVIVYENKIIGEGWHQNYGGPHAEVNAIESVKDKSLLKESTVYVTLEPCSHYGKTPPCADLLIRHHVKKVVICNVDINPLVSGKGMTRLRNAGIEVVENILWKKGDEVNKRFFTFFQKQRPFVILKWAQTADGFIARENYDSKWISNEFSRKLVHKWRAEEDAVLVGTNTAFYDNPTLNVRDWSGKSPLRIAIDRNLRLPTSLKLFDGTIPTIVYNLHKEEEEQNLKFVKLDPNRFIEHLLRDLFIQKIQSVIVEGGSTVLSEFINNGLWDEMRVFVAKTNFGSGIEAPKINFTHTPTEDIMGDTLYYIKNRRKWLKS